MTEERNSSVVGIPKLHPGARFVVNACRALDCFSDAGSNGLTRRELAEVSGVNISSLKGHLQWATALGIVVEMSETAPVRYQIGDRLLSQTDFKRAMPPAGTQAALVKALWVLSCFTDDAYKTNEAIAAITGFSHQVIASILGALISIGYLTAYPRKPGQPRKYRRTAKVASSDKSWIRLVVVSAPRVKAA
jgi:DNA-binding IclR family transcriptional regulator